MIVFVLHVIVFVLHVIVFVLLVFVLHVIVWFGCFQFEPFLLAQLNKTMFEGADESNAPLCSPAEGTSLLCSLSEVACAHRLQPPPPLSSLTTKEEGEEGEMTAWQQLERVLQLLVVLWGDLPPELSPG